MSDPYGGRRPTSHERLSGVAWDASYRNGPAPWDIGQPQPAVVRLAADGRFTGAVLDAGCGTGENALYIASLGLAVFGVDVAETAIARARATAEERGLRAEFAVADALQLERLGRRFDTVLDCGLFHSLNDEERAEYVRGLAAVTADGGCVHLLCFRDEGPDIGPHPVSLAKLRDAFAGDGGWEVVGIRRDRLRTRFHDEKGAPAWSATIKRVSGRHSG